MKARGARATGWEGGCADGGVHSGTAAASVSREEVAETGPFRVTWLDKAPTAGLS